MEASSGIFVVSLDFELFWGVRDKRTIESYGDALRATHIVIPRMLELFNRYGVKSTFATVGFLFAENKKEIIEFSPATKPNYKNPNLSPYNDNFDLVKDNLKQDPYHYAFDLLKNIRSQSHHEIASHTFSHYYCQEEGQTAKDFEEDLKAAVAIAANKEIKLESLVFPRNQFSENYMEICRNNGVKTIRGNEKVWFNKPESEENTKLSKRVARTLDCYLNISGHHSYDLNELATKEPYNIPSSRFLRSYNKKLRILEGLKLRRIKKSMTYAAKNGKLYHLWWHPHNYGRNIEDNFKILESIVKHYQRLNVKYGFESKTMAETGKVLEKLSQQKR